MRTHPKLALVPATGGANTSNVVHISSIGSQAPAPRRTEWRDLMRRIVKSHGKSAPGDTGWPDPSEHD